MKIGTNKSAPPATPLRSVTKGLYESEIELDRPAAQPGVVLTTLLGFFSGCKEIRKSLDKGETWEYGAPVLTNRRDIVNFLHLGCIVAQEGHKCLQRISQPFDFLGTDQIV